MSSVNDTPQVVNGNYRYYFPTQEELTSHLEKHTSSKDVRIIGYYPKEGDFSTEKIIAITAKFFAKKHISHSSIQLDQIEKHLDNLFLQYKDYYCMPSVKEKLATALKDYLFKTPENSVGEMTKT